jgi:hypothetical protein
MRGCGSGSRGTRDHRAYRRLARNRRDRRRGWNNNICGLTRLGHDAPWRRRRSRSGGRDRRDCGNRNGGRCYCSWCCRSNMGGGRRRSSNNRSRTRRRGLGGGVSLLTLENGLERVAGLRHLGEIKLRLDLGGLPAGAGAAIAAVEIAAHLLRLIGLDGAGVRLSRNADRFKRIENRPALYFQFSCQIVNSNFAHPSLFASLRP